MIFGVSSYVWKGGALKEVYIAWSGEILDGFDLNSNDGFDLNSNPYQFSIEEVMWI